MEVSLLPFLKAKDKSAGISGVMIKERAPDEHKEDDQYDEGAGIEACASDLISAIERKDVKAVAQILKDAFELLESQPHEEGEHINEGQE